MRLFTFSINSWHASMQDALHKNMWNGGEKWLSGLQHAPNHANWSTAFRRKHIAFIGDSTVRQVLHTMVRLPTSCERFGVACPSNLGDGWMLQYANCSDSDVGCPECVCKCRVGDWADYTIHNVQLATTFKFYWRPELWHPSDRALFTNKLCRHPPDLLVIGKGVHDSFFHDLKRGINDHTVSVRLHNLGLDLECLPADTLIILLTPTSDDLHQPNSSSFKARFSVAAALNSSNSYLQRHTRTHAFVLDRYTLTMGYTRQNVSSGGNTGTRHHAIDGIHFPNTVNEVLRDGLVAVFTTAAHGNFGESYETDS